MRETQERIIGRIEGKLDRLIEDRAETAKNQARLYAEIEHIKYKQDYVSDRLEAVSLRLAQVEKPLAELSLWRERAVGAAMVVSFITAGLGGAAVLFGQKLAAAVKMWI